MTTVATSGSSSAAAGPRTRRARPAWLGLLAQPIAVLVVFAGFVVWLMTADLTTAERTTLNPGELLTYTGEHLALTFVSAAIVLVLAIPLGILLTRRPFVRISGPVLVIANFGQAAPAIGLIVLLAFWLGFTFWAAVVALVLYAVLPVLRNTMIGLQSVDPRLVEAGRGMGMSSISVLFRVELPLAVPVMLSGIRTALVLLVGSAALATFIGAGGLGLLITTGVNLFLPKVLVSGALLIALLALMIDWLGRVVEYVARPKGTLTMTVSHRSRVLRRASSALAVVAASTLALTGCGLQPATAFVPAVAPGSIAAVDDLPDGAAITVTSKNFTEQLILGKIAVLAAQAAGFEVTDMTNVPGSVAVRQLMLDGTADMTYEYTGTAWLTYLAQQEGIPDQRQQYEAVRDADADNGLTWLDPAPLNNTYAMAVRSEAVPELGDIGSLSQIADLPVDQRTFCVEAEFNSRADGFAPMLAAYGLELGSPDGVPTSNVSILDTGTVYTATDRGRCNFGEVFTTDGRIDSLDLTVLDDDQGFFPAYNAAPVLSSATLEQYPQLAGIYDQISPALTDTEMRRLNLAVDVEGEEPADVAFDWMVEKGFVTRP